MVQLRRRSERRQLIATSRQPEGAHGPCRIARGTARWQAKVPRQMELRAVAGTPTELDAHRSVSARLGWRAHALNRSGETLV
jgi:hypothetical protein